MTDNKDTGFNKYQYSYFIDSTRNEQIVIRANDSKEFMNAIAKVKELFPVDDADKALDKIAGERNQGKPVQEAISTPTRQCAFPGCPGLQTYKSGVSQKTGKPWQGWFCSANKDHINWTK